MYTTFLSLILAVASPAQSATPETNLQPTNEWGCDKLSYDEQQFAQNLSDDSAMLFCSKFSLAQRKEVLDMYQQTKSSGSMITNDDIVDSIAAKYGMSAAYSDETATDESPEDSSEQDAQ